MPRSTVNARALRFEPLEDRRLLTTITVNTLADENNGVGNGDISLRDALAAANPGDTIQFDELLFEDGPATIILTHNQLVVNKSLTITGRGADLLTIDANGASRVFNIDDGTSGFATVTISGLTITGGKVLDDGGGIRNRENLTIDRCHITGNSADDGGGIANIFATFAIIDSTISHNSSSSALDGGGGIFSHSENLPNTSTIRNSTISSNTAITKGGGIYNFRGTLHIEYSTIVDNAAANNLGSGVATLGDLLAASTTVRSSIIAGNASTDVDRVVGLQNSFVTNGYNLVGNGNVSVNFTATGDVNSVTDAALLLGPLADNGGPTPTHLPLPGSPAIDTGNPAFSTPPAFDQRGTPFGRVFDGDGNSIAIIDKGAVETDAVYLVVDTLADEDDGDFGPSDFSLREAIGEANEMSSGTPTIRFAASLTSGGPATINLALNQLHIAGRVVIQGPGADLLAIDAGQSSRVLLVDDGEEEVDSEVWISGLTIRGGQHGEGGGGIHSSERLTLRDSTITGNTARYGGGIYNNPTGKLVLERSLVSGNHAVKPAAEEEAHGGAVYNWGGSIAIHNSTISGNDAGNDGGALMNANNGEVLITESTISGNSADRNGGGVTNGDGTLRIVRSTISGNHASRGGGVFVGTPNSRVTMIRNSTISGNVAPLGGGGVENSSGKVFFEFCTITENVSNDNAGSGVRSAPSFVDSPTSFYNSLIAANFDPNAPPQALVLDIHVGDEENSLISRGYNIVGNSSFATTWQGMGDQLIGNDDPLLGPLADNGGPTRTHALLSGSPALDQGDADAIPGANGVPHFDQRGKPFGRIRDGDPPASILMDVGAFEAQSIPPALLGDYNLNGTVDTADFVIWRNTLNSSVFTYSGADGNGNGIVDQADYSVWRSNFGSTSPAAAAMPSRVVVSGILAPDTIPIAATARFHSASQLTHAPAKPPVAPPANLSRTAVTSGLSLLTTQFFAVAFSSEWPRSNSDSVTATTSASAQNDSALLAWLASQHQSPGEVSARIFAGSQDVGCTSRSSHTFDDSTADAALATWATDVRTVRLFAARLHARSPNTSR